LEASIRDKESLGVEISSFIPDLLRVQMVHGDVSKSVTVIDIKSSSVPQFHQKIQVIHYLLLLCLIGWLVSGVNVHSSASKSIEGQQESDHCEFNWRTLASRRNRTTESTHRHICGIAKIISFQFSSHRPSQNPTLQFTISNLLPSLSSLQYLQQCGYLPQPSF
jgi:hypothetical protein